MNALTDLDRRLRCVVEIPVAAILHPDLHLVAGLLAHGMLNAVARKATADGAGNRCQNATASSADLISQQPASDCAAYGPETRCRLGLLNRVDGDYFAGIRVNGDWPLRGLRRGLICVVVPVALGLLN
ncbi:hypothetical protein HDG38_001724 [Paraburkholderia sp. WSM4177]|nr:hypothetical protein [Paraburkholderia sp. WSM4177]MBB5483281.1 hypothetical protein [Paraburkholderia sp. WSM4180]